MYRIRQLLLRDCPPVGHLEAEIADGCTIFLGRNGSGKTSLFRAIRDGAWPNGGRFQLVTEGALDKGLYPLMYVDDRADCFETLLETLPPELAEKARTPDFADALATTLADHFNENRESFRYDNLRYRGPATFSVTVTQSHQLRVEAEYRDVAPDITRVFFDSQSAAAGEQMFIVVAALLALRRLNEVDAPLVADSILGRLDQEWMRLVCGLLQQNCPQPLLICTPSESHWAKRHVRNAATVWLHDPAMTRHMTEAEPRLYCPP